MLDLVSVPPVAQGGLVVGAILVLAITLYFGYATVEQFLAERMLQAIDET